MALWTEDIEGTGKIMKRFFLSILILLLFSCSHTEKKPTVIIYTALDQIFSKNILDKFEKETGIKVRAVYDTEATKTVGLVNRIVAEANNPQCDVFWNNEICRTVMLKRKGILKRYKSPSAEDIPSNMKDSEGYWTGFAARTRILIYNKNMLKEDDLPSSILDLTNPEWRGRVSFAYPLFGTTSTHAAALFVYMGDENAKAYFRALQENNVVIVDGNASSKDAVARGEVPLGFTDTDDANIAIEQGKPVGIIFPDQGENQMGTLIIPNTAALIKKCPHPEEGKKLIDFLLSRETERMLAYSGSAQIPVRVGIPVPESVMPISDIKSMTVDWEIVEGKLGESSRFLEELFIR